MYVWLSDCTGCSTRDGGRGTAAGKAGSLVNAANTDTSKIFFSIRHILLKIANKAHSLQKNSQICYAQSL